MRLRFPAQRICGALRSFCLQVSKVVVQKSITLWRKVRSTDTDHDQNIAIWLDLLSSFQDAVEFFAVVVFVGPTNPKSLPAPVPSRINSLQLLLCLACIPLHVATNLSKTFWKSNLIWHDNPPKFLLFYHSAPFDFFKLFYWICPIL